LIFLHIGLGLSTHLFVNGSRPGDRKGTFSVFELSFHLLLLVRQLKGRDNPVKCLAHSTTSELAGLYYPFFMLNVKQRSCEYQLLKSFGLTRPGSPTQDYRRSNH